MRRYQPPALPGWAPMTTPTPARPAWPRIVAVVAILGLFAAIWFRAGFLALGLALALGLLLRGRPDKGRAVIELLTAGTLTLLLSGAPAPKTPTPKPPVKVEASQVGQLEPIRKGAINLYAQMAQGFPILPDPPKEGGG